MTPLPPRLRVVVMGNSTTLQVRPKRKRRTDGTYAEVLERQLRERGLDALVINEGAWWELITHGFQRWEEAVARHSPDVLVLNYGLGECQPRIWPNWLIKYLGTWRTVSHGPGRMWREWITRPALRVVAKINPYLTPRLGLRTWRVAPTRFQHDLRRLIQTTRWETGSLVLVMTVNPPGPMLQKLMPGIDERADIYRDLTRETVAELAADDEDVRLVEAHEVVERLGWRKANLDGLHYTPQGHREVATLLEHAIVDWVREGRSAIDPGLPLERSSD